jgi:hypothetical protein
MNRYSQRQKGVMMAVFFFLDVLLLHGNLVVPFDQIYTGKILASWRAEGTCQVL